MNSTAAFAERRAAALWIYALAIALTALICASVWPGFMTSDSFTILHEARHGVDNNRHPAMVIYVQWLCERIYPGPGAFFVFQVGLFFIALADVLVVAGVSLPLSVMTLLFIALCPSMLGPLVCVWKDTGMLAFFMASFAAIIRADASPQHKRGWAWLGLVMIAMGSAFRHNAFLPAVPLIVSCAHHCFPRTRTQSNIAAVAFLATVAASTMLLDTFRLPDLKRIPDGYLIETMLLFDTVGTAAMSGDMSFIPPSAYARYPEFSLIDLKRDYSPEAVDKTFAVWHPGQKPLDSFNSTPQQLAHLWSASILKHPKAYLEHRWKADKALLGIGYDHAYYLTAGGTEANVEGVELKQTGLTKLLMRYLRASQSWILAMPWFYYLSGALLFVAICRVSFVTGRAKLLIISAFSLLLPLLAFSIAADLRYHLWAIAAIILSAVLTASSWSASRSILPVGAISRRKLCAARVYVGRFLPRLGIRSDKQ